MKNWIRVTLASVILVGSAAFFAYQSFNQLNDTLDSLSASSYTTIVNVSSFFSHKANTTNTDEISTTTLEIISTTATSTNFELSFVFPEKYNKVYVGCEYEISLQASSTIYSLETSLIDANTGESAGPIASGLAKENIIDEDSQNLIWKVGGVWPGEHYIKVSKINGVEVETKSKYFTINQMPEDISASERENICEEYKPET